MEKRMSSNELEEPVSCGSCEAVCCRLKVVLMPDDDVPGHYVDRDERDLEVMARLDDGWCIALDRDTMRCTIYATRPYICGYYEMGGSECRSEREAWRQVSLVLV